MNQEPEDGKSPEAARYVSVGMTTTTFPADASAAKEQFARFQALHIEQAIEPSYLAALLKTLETSTFVADAPAPGFREVESSPQRAGRLLNLTLNRPELLRWLEDVTGCGPLKTIEGRVVQTLLRPGDELLWHDDLLATAGRRVAIVINLSTRKYGGGDFQLRWKGGEIVVEHHHSRLGSALLFRVESRLEHRVLPLTFGGPRRVFAGWAFRGDPE